MKKLAGICLSLLLILAIPMQMVSAEGTSGVFALADATAYPGGTVQIPIQVEANPGIVGTRLFVSYDANVLTLQSTQDETLFGGGTMVFGNDLAENPFGIVWEDSLSRTNYTQTGTFVTLTFAVAADAPVGETAVTLTYDQGSTFDTNLENVAFEVRSSSVTILAVQEEELIVKTAPAKTAYTVGEELDTTGLVLTYVDQYGVSTDITSGFTCTPTTLSTVGTQTITVSCNGLTATFDVEVAAAAADPIFAAGSGSACPGETVDIPILIEGNPGIAGLRLYVQYDADVLTLQSAQDAGLFPSGVVLGNDYTENPYGMLWEDALSQTNYTQNGTFAVLTFRVKENSPAGDTPITVIVDAGSVFDTNLTIVAFGARAGSIHIEESEEGGWSFDPDTTLHLMESHNGETFVVGLDADDPQVSSYVLTTGGWSFDVELNDQDCESTGAVLNIYNADEELVESYLIVLFGDINGDGEIGNADVMVLLDIAQGMSPEPWSRFDETDENPRGYAADITHDFTADMADAMLIIDCVNFNYQINQNWSSEEDPTEFRY